jgi:thioredoxin-like negative regulator of GroEL
MKRLAFLVLLAAAPLHAATDAAPASIDAALERAKIAHAPVLIDFSAPWCYSCYFMATHVLNGPEWEAIEAKTIVVEVDADSPDGNAWMKKLKVRALPSYVVLNGRGEELGRILAEQPREKFYPALDTILGDNATLAELKKKAAAGSTAAIADVLESWQVRGDGAGGLAWYASLDDEIQVSAKADKAVMLQLDRLEMRRAEKAKDHPAALAAAQRVLAGDIGCDRPYIVFSLLDASEEVPTAGRKALLAPHRAALDAFLDKQTFVTPPPCADQRSAVLATADVDAALDDQAAEAAVLDRAIEDARKRLAGDLHSDRNLADNLRVYLARAGRTEELDALYPRLIAAWPDDYVYPYRYGRSLLDRGDAKAALPLLEKAADKAYGENRLTVATLRVKALKALDRESDAKKVAAEALEQNGKWFPDSIAKLEAALKS